MGVAKRLVAMAFAPPPLVVLAMTAYRLAIGGVNLLDSSPLCNWATGAGCAKLTPYESFISALGDFVAFVGLERSWAGATLVVYAFCLGLALYGLWVLSAPQPAYETSRAELYDNFKRAPVQTKAAVLMLYAAGAVAMFLIVKVLWF